MKADTKIYSDFIKKNAIDVSKNFFRYKGLLYGLSKDKNGWLVTSPTGVQSNELYITKKSAIYYTIKTETLTLVYNS